MAGETSAGRRSGPSSDSRPERPGAWSGGLRAALEGIGVEARHIRSEKEVAAIMQAQAEQAQAEEAVELAKGGAQAARDMAQAEAV